MDRSTFGQLRTETHIDNDLLQYDHSDSDVFLFIETASSIPELGIETPMILYQPGDLQTFGFVSAKQINQLNMISDKTIDNVPSMVPAGVPVAWTYSILSDKWHRTT